MKLVALAAVLALLLGGCSNWDRSLVPVTTAYNLDGTFAGDPMRKPRQRQRPAREANASIETTGSVSKSADDLEQDYMAELINTKPNTPEWLALRKKLDDGRAERNNRERAGLTICRNC